MKKALKKIAEAFHRYNPEHMAAQAFGLGKDMRIKRHGHMTRKPRKQPKQQRHPGLSGKASAGFLP